MKHSRLIALVVGLMASALASAQEAPPAKDLLLARQVFIALRSEVSKELKITAEQRKKIEEAFNGGLQVEGDKVMLMISGGESIEDMAADAMKAIEPAQTTRLREIWLQESGSLAILDPGIAKELGISKEQAEKANKVAESAAGKVMELFQDMTGDHSAAAKQVNALRDDARKQIDAQLTEEQKKKLETLKGKPFKFPKPVGG